MCDKKIAYTIIKYLIATVWFINGLLCKVLNFVPRHQQIVAEITGSKYADVFTKVIGIAEIGMVIWIISGIKTRWCTIIQIIVIPTMNVIEYFIAPHLLLFGKGNIFFAFLLIIVIYCNEFFLNKKTASQPAL